MKIQANGNDLYYRLDGPTDAPVVMLGHATGTSHRIWDWQINSLARRWRVLRYDFRGHGDSEIKHSPSTMTELVNDAIGLMDALKIESVHWVGLSTGGMIGQGLGIYHGDRVKSLALCNTASQATPLYRDSLEERRAAAFESGMTPAWEATKRLWFTDEYVDQEDPGYCVVRDIFQACDVDGYYNATAAIKGLAYHDKLKQISVPTLVLAAGDDPVTPVSQSEFLRDNIPGAQMLVLPGQRHFSNIEQPNSFNGALLPFLAEHY